MNKHTVDPDKRENIEVKGVALVLFQEVVFCHHKHQKEYGFLVLLVSHTLRTVLSCGNCLCVSVVASRNTTGMVRHEVYRKNESKL